MIPFETHAENVKETLHGIEITDPFRWLEDQESPDTREWIKKQNDFVRPVLDSYPRRKEITQRLHELLAVDSTLMPIEKAGFYFFRRRRADEEQYSIYIREGYDGEDQLLINPADLSDDNSKSVHLIDVSDDASLLVYGIRSGGEDELVIKVFDVGNRVDLPDKFTKERFFGFSITPDNKGIYYSISRTDGPRIQYHKIGTDSDVDETVFGGDLDPVKILFSTLSENGRWLTIHVLHGSAGSKTEIHCIDLQGDGKPFPIVDDVEARFFGGFLGNRLFIRTNHEAPNKRIMVCEPEKGPKPPMKEVVAESEAVLEEFDLAGGRLILKYLDNVKSKVKIYNTDGEFIRDMELPSAGTVGSMAGKESSSELFFSFTSFHIPLEIHRYNLETGERDLWFKIDAPIDRENVIAEQVWYESKDGTKIPMFLVHKKDLELNGENPVLITGYGGFTLSMTPSFSAKALVWIESGGIYAMPNLRGGGEFGEKWHLNGMQAKKQNTFDDFHAAIEWLIKKGYTRAEKVAATGRSNGGLLMGALLTQRPDLAAAVVVGYPLLDMIRFHKFLVGRYWVPEYGNPDDPSDFEYIFKYSPYHNVKKGTEFPSTMIVSGDSDTRVAPLHARKMAALMQRDNGSDNPVYLLYDVKNGHVGGQPVEKQVVNQADELSFVMGQIGI